MRLLFLQQVRSRSHQWWGKSFSLTAWWKHHKISYQNKRWRQFQLFIFKKNPRVVLKKVLLPRTWRVLAMPLMEPVSHFASHASIWCAKSVLSKNTANTMSSLVTKHPWHLFAVLSRSRKKWKSSKKSLRSSNILVHSKAYPQEWGLFKTHTWKLMTFFCESKNKFNKAAKI